MTNVISNDYVFHKSNIYCSPVAVYHIFNELSLNLLVVTTAYPLGNSPHYQLAYLCSDAL